MYGPVTVLLHVFSSVEMDYRAALRTGAGLQAPTNHTTAQHSADQIKL